MKNSLVLVGILLGISVAQGQSEEARVQMLKDQIKANPCFGMPLKAGETCTLSEPLTLAEIQQLQDPDLQSKNAALFFKMNKRIETPLVRNFSNQVPADKLADGTIRVLELNLERFYKFDATKAFINNCDELIARHLKPGVQVTPHERESICRATTADFYILNEADAGVCRSGYRSGEELAMRTGMNFAQVMEWFEVRPTIVGLKDGENGCSMNEVNSIQDSEPSKILNEQHNVLLSRFPIKSAKRIALKQCYDWYSEELKKEDGQVRRGTRSALIAEVDLPGTQAGSVAIVVAHLENKTYDNDCRHAQLQQIIDELERMDQVRGRSIPVVLGGDMNSIHVSNIKMALFMKSKGYQTDFTNFKNTFITEVKGQLLKQTLDYIFTKSKDSPKCFKPVNAATIAEASPFDPKQVLELSDHAPIITDVPVNCAPEKKSILDKIKDSIK
jgi:endonuclease/exonuclease/phosphatase family metal-dependent hydrolase